ncbi:hypothetical protein Y1Q_0004641 [Alligator mississippiensis]|uniref:Uncharacterized protein n=1 Tax=Alligator mississippiensis TaxID=8496 RepID=A0A151MI45_ALLMI|nr:hypothetical protein Y1Q_0004641 [Alligator mississippiensis]
MLAVASGLRCSDDHPGSSISGSVTRPPKKNADSEDKKKTEGPMSGNRNNSTCRLEFISTGQIVNVHN